MNFNMKEAVEILERTPQTVESLLSGLSDNWLQSNEGEGTWNASEVVDHLIENEKKNWIPRLEMMLQDGENRTFPPFDRYAHLKHPSEKSLVERLAEFKALRMQNLEQLHDLVNPEEHLERTGVHPALGVVKLREMLSTWVVHDLTHLAQITRVIAKRYGQDVGPWKEYLSILK